MMVTLRELRKRWDLTQEELGMLVEVKQRTIASYELGTSLPSPLVAGRIRDLFGLTIEEMWKMLYRRPA